MAPERDSHASPQRKLVYERYYLESSILNQSTHRPGRCPEGTRSSSATRFVIATVVISTDRRDQRGDAPLNCHGGITIPDPDPSLLTRRRACTMVARTCTTKPKSDHVQS